MRSPARGRLHRLDDAGVIDVARIVDGTSWDIADSADNQAAFGRPGNSRDHNKSSFPQARMACLVEVCLLALTHPLSYREP